MSESRLSEMYLVVDNSGENPFARGVDDTVCVVYDIFRQFSLYDGFDKLSFDDDAPDEVLSIVYDRSVCNDCSAHDRLSFGASAVNFSSWGICGTNCLFLI